MSSSNLSGLLGWRHLVEKPTSAEDVEQKVRRGSIPAFSFYFMLIVSAVIAALGLLADSAAVIIGAMIIAPLMQPIIALSYGLIARRGLLIIQSLLTAVTGTLLTIGAAAVITEVIGWKLAGPEIVARMKPTLLDLGVALAAGAAAAYAYTRPGISSALAGVAIAVALVPPLCTAGIAIAMGEDVSVEVGLAMDSFSVRGPLLLYLTNFVGIIFAGSMVFYWHYFRHRVLALLTLVLILGSMVVVVPPLGVSMENMLIRNQVRRNITVISQSLLPEDTKARLTNLSVHIGQGTIYVRGGVVAQPGQITQELIDEIRDRLSEMTGRPCVLEIGIITESVVRSTEGGRS